MLLVDCVYVRYVYLYTYIYKRYDETQLKRVTQFVSLLKKHSTEIIFDYDDYVMYIQDDMENNNQVEHTAQQSCNDILHCIYVKKSFSCWCGVGMYTYIYICVCIVLFIYMTQSNMYKRQPESI